MNSEERDVINGIFQRLEQASQQPRDADAERFIADKIRAQPYAPYAMAQLIYVQEEAIKSLNQQLEQARAEAQRGGQGAGQGSGGGGFFSSIFGGGSRPEPQQPPQRAGAWGNQGGGYGQQPGYGGPQGGYPPQQPGYAPQQGGPWGGQQPPQQRGGGFLATALPMAAGAAGGMLLGSALSNAFAGGHSSLGSMAGLGGAGAAGAGGETVVENNYFGNAGGQDFGAPLGGGGGDADFQDASFDGDGGDGSDDWV